MCGCLVLVLALQSPVKVGVYDDRGSLLRTFDSNKQVSFALVEVFDALLAWVASCDLKLQAICYAKGPGSFMAMKLTHVFLHTLALIRSLDLYSTSGFAFNNNTPIRAFGKMHYVLEQEEIRLIALKDAPTPCQPSLPAHLDLRLFSQDNQPLYLLPPV